MWGQVELGALPAEDGVAPEGVVKVAESAGAPELEFDSLDVWGCQKMRLAMHMGSFWRRKCEANAPGTSKRELWQLLLHIEGNRVGGPRDTGVKASGLVEFLLRAIERGKWQILYHHRQG